MFNWIKSLFVKKPTAKAECPYCAWPYPVVMPQHDKKPFKSIFPIDGPIPGVEKPKKRPKLNKQATVVTKGEISKVRKAPVKKVAKKSYTVKESIDSIKGYDQKKPVAKKSTTTKGKK